MGDGTGRRDETASVPSAVYTGPGQITIEALEPVPPGPGDAVVAVSHCGICGTDLHMIADGWGVPGSVGGHEYSGVVVAVGESVTDLAPGDRVVNRPGHTCGTCRFCARGRPSLCEARHEPGPGGQRGGFATSVTVPAERLVAVPDRLSLRTAALAEPLAVALHGLSRAAMDDDARAFVSGAGPIGALIAAVLVGRGHPVVVSEPSPVRRSLATRVGATAVEPGDLEVPSVAEPGRLVAEPFAVAFECSGRPDAAIAALAQLDRAGTLVLLGTGMEQPTFDTNRILLNELIVTGAYNYDDGGIEAALELLAAGELPVDALVEPADTPLDELASTVAALTGGHVAGKVLVAPVPSPTQGVDP